MPVLPILPPMAGSAEYMRGRGGGSDTNRVARTDGKCTSKGGLAGAPLWPRGSMVRTLIYLAAVVAVGSGVGFGQDRLSKFQKKVEKNWEELRPRGKLLQQFRDSFRSERDERDRSDQQPTPAAPRGTGDSSAAAPTGSAGGGGWKLPWRDDAEPDTKDRLNSNSPWPRTARRDPDDRNVQEKEAAKSRTPRSNNSSKGKTANQRAASNSRGNREAASAERNSTPTTEPTGEPATRPGVSLGVVMDEKQSTKQGLRIDKVARHSPADRAGLRNGDVLLTIAGVEMSDLQILDQLLTAFGPQDQVQIEYQRGKKKAETMLSFSDESLPTDESIADAPQGGAYDDASLAPLPPGLPAAIEGESAAPTNPGLISVLDEPRRINRDARANANRASTVPARVYPSPQVLPPLTGSSVAIPPGSSILREPAPRGGVGLPDKSLFRRLPPQEDSPPPNAPAADSGEEELLDIELLSPDGN